LLDELETTDDAALVADEDQASVIDGLLLLVWLEFGPIGDARPPEPVKSDDWGINERTCAESSKVKELTGASCY